MFLQIFQLLALTNSSTATPIKVTIFSLCLHSHLRAMLSIAKELGSRPEASVTFIVSKECEELILNFGFPIEIESVDTKTVNWTGSFEPEYLDDYLNAVETPLLEHYIEAWRKSPQKKPDIIVSDFLSLTAIDLGEVFSIQNIVVYPTMDPHRFAGDTNLDSEYLSVVTKYASLPDSDNILYRALKYGIKRTMVFIFNQYLVRRRNQLRARFELGPVTTLLGNGLETPYFVFYESFFGFDEPRLIPPFVENIGPLTLKELETPNDLEITEWLEKCNSFIYVAVGSITSISEEQAEVFHKTFESFPYSFLVSSKTFVSELPNVKVVKWVNQIEVLQHPRLLAFISHGGISSIMEAIESIIPLICLPQGKDHFFHCDRVKSIGIGETLRPESLNVNTLSKAIEIVIQNHRYKAEMQKIKIIMKIQGGEKRIADAAIEFAKVGYQHLIPRWYSLPWYQKNELDIFVVYLGIIFALLITIKHCLGNCKQKIH